MTLKKKCNYNKLIIIKKKREKQKYLYKVTSAASDAAKTNLKFETKYMKVYIFRLIVSKIYITIKNPIFESNLFNLFIAVSIDKYYCFIHC